MEPHPDPRYSDMPTMRLPLTFLIGMLIAQPVQAAGLVFISPLRLGVDSYLKLVRDGALAAGAALSMPTQVFESTDPETRSENLRAAIRGGASIVVVTGFEFADIVPDAAADNPNVQFLLVDECPTETAPNLFCVLFREQEASFLAGAEAALTSKAGRVGTVAASDIPFEHRYGDAFAAGARQSKPGIDIASTLYVGGDTPFSDPLRAQSQAAAMLSGGVDRVFAASSAGNGGVFAAVAATPGALAIGVDTNQCGAAAGRVLDSAVKHVDHVTTMAIEAIAHHTQPPAASYGIKEGGVGLTSQEAGAAGSLCLVVGMKEVAGKLAALRDDIVAGRITVADPMAAH
jgi:basic membrane protein A